MNQLTGSQSDLSKVSLNNNQPIDTTNLTKKSGILVDMITLESSIKRKANYVNKEKTVDIRKNFIVKGSGKKETYIGDITLKDKFAYVGTLMGRQLVRSGVGFYSYPNKDLYFGHWINNEKNNLGVYSYYTPEDEIEYYIGEWKDGVKNGFGIYFWKKEDIEKNELETYDVFIGSFKNGGISEGLYLKRKIVNEITSTHYYFGKFNEDAKRSDKNSFYFTTDNEVLIYGHIEDSTFINGKIIQQKDDRIFSFEKKENQLELGNLEYVPEQVTEEDIVKELKDIYENFKDFERKLDINCFSDLVETIYGIIDRHSSLNTFSTDDLFLEKELRVEFFRGMYIRFTDLIVKLMEKEQEKLGKKRDSMIRYSSTEFGSNNLIRKSSGYMKATESSQSLGDLNNISKISPNKPLRKETLKSIPEKNENEIQSKRNSDAFADSMGSLKKSDSLTGSKILHRNSVKDTSKKMSETKSEKNLVKKDSGNVDSGVSAFTLKDNQK